MTAFELRKAVCGLAQIDAIDPYADFGAAYNMSLLRINQLRPRTAYITVEHYPSRTQGETSYCITDRADPDSPFMEFFPPYVSGTDKFRMFGDTVYFPNTENGRFRVYYQRQPKQYDYGSSTLSVEAYERQLQVDLPPDLSPMMPKLMAYYLCDDDTLKVRLYSDFMAEYNIKAAKERILSRDDSIINTNGWG